MTSDTALEHFLETRLEARSAAVERASVRGHKPVGELPDELPGIAFCHALSDSLDEALTELAADGGAGFAVIAVGGYGRREQCRHSDIDLMLLVEGRPPESVTGMLYPLWDAALKVGHSVRSVNEAMEAARQNVETLTALFDARLVSGDAELFARFVRARRKLARAQRRELERELAARRSALVERERWQLQEPDVKNGRGGLRSLQAVHWLEAAEALAAGDEPPALAPPLAEAHETLLATRNALHALSDRPNDRFRHDLAGPVAAWLGVDPGTWGKRLLAAMRVVDAAAAERLAQSPPRSGVARWLPRRRRAVSGVDMKGATDLERLIDALRNSGPERLDPLPPSEWLTRLLPEWEALRCVPHIAPFHRHPVDVHCWRTVDEALYAMRHDEDDTATPAVAAHLAEREVLLSALLHDIGKGHEGDHSEVGAVIVERFASRAGLDPGATRRLSNAAAMHLLLPAVATRRDISDPQVIQETATQVGDAHTLHLLYLISVADARASGPDVWGAWKAQLMRQLYLRVLDVLSADEPDAATATVARRQRVIEALAGTHAESEVLAHLDQLPPNYLLGASAEMIGQHLTMIREAAGGTAVRRDRAGAVDRLTLVTPDHPGILSRVAGTLAVHNASVLGGSAFTRDDDVAIEVMHVNDGLGHEIDDRRWQRILEAVRQALAGEFPIDERLAETRRTYHAVPRVPIETTVHVDNSGSDRYSIVEVGTSDRLGLLYAITRALHDLALDIHLAKVDTLGAEVVDAFYVLRENGRRIEGADEIERVARRVKEAVAALDAPVE